MKTRVLPIIGIAFAIMVLTRTGAISSEAKSENVDQAAPAILERQATHKSPDEHDNSTNSAPKENMDSQSICLTGDVLTVIETDLKVIKNRKAELNIREQTLAALEEKISHQIAEIDTANAVLEQRANDIKALANSDINHLIEMYQVMKPKEAAAIIESMDPVFAAGILRQMSGSKAGLIMANIDSRKSYAISVIIASKNAKYR